MIETPNCLARYSTRYTNVAGSICSHKLEPMKQRRRKSCSHIARYPIHWTTGWSFTSPTGRSVHSDRNSPSLGSVKPRCNCCLKTIHSYTIFIHHCLYSSAHLYSWMNLGIANKMKCPSSEAAASGTLDLTYDVRTRP